MNNIPQNVTYWVVRKITDEKMRASQRTTFAEAEVSIEGSLEHIRHQIVHNMSSNVVRMPVTEKGSQVIEIWY